MVDLVKVNKNGDIGLGLKHPPPFGLSPSKCFFTFPNNANCKDSSSEAVQDIAGHRTNCVIISSFV